MKMMTVTVLTRIAAPSQMCMAPCSTSMCCSNLYAPLCVEVADCITPAAWHVVSNRKVGVVCAPRVDATVVRYLAPSCVFHGYSQHDDGRCFVRVFRDTGYVPLHSRKDPCKLNLGQIDAYPPEGLTEYAALVKCGKDYVLDMMRQASCEINCELDVAQLATVLLWRIHGHKRSRKQQ